MTNTLNDVSRRDKLGLIAEWMDPHACLIRKFYFFFYPYDSTIELYDLKKNRLFLKRTKVNNLDFGDIYVGNVVTVFSRQLKLVGYANVLTERLLAVKMMKTFAIIKPDGIDEKATIFQIILSNGFKITNLLMLKIPENLAQKLFEHEKDSETYIDLINHLQSGPSIIMELVGENAIDKLMEIAGPKDPGEARKQDPDTIIAKFGQNEVHNTFYYAPSAEIATKEIQLMFENDILRDEETHTALLDDSTCCIIKPHVMREGKFGEIISSIESKGFKITAMRMFYLDTAQAEEFYEIYKGIIAEFNDMVHELISGGCVAMEIAGPYGKDTPLYFRALVGPSDPDIARNLRPDTLRAHYGENRIQNALHATDLPTDGVLEVEYFFKVLI